MQFCTRLWQQKSACNIHLYLVLFLLCYKTLKSGFTSICGVCCCKTCLQSCLLRSTGRNGDPRMLVGWGWGGGSGYQHHAVSTKMFLNVCCYLLFWQTYWEASCFGIWFSGRFSVCVETVFRYMLSCGQSEIKQCRFCSVNRPLVVLLYLSYCQVMK